jgi:hypothetical protein
VVRQAKEGSGKNRRHSAERLNRRWFDLDEEFLSYFQNTKARYRGCTAAVATRTHMDTRAHAPLACVLAWTFIHDCVSVYAAETMCPQERLRSAQSRQWTVACMFMTHHSSDHTVSEYVHADRWCPRQLL